MNNKENAPMYAPINDYPWYLACSDGYVINTDSGHILKGSVKKTGYVEILLRDENGTPHYVTEHRIIAQCFCERSEGANEVNHIDGNKENNAAYNLEWVTREKNLIHAFETGLMPNNTAPKRVIAEDMETGETITFPSIYQAAKCLQISKGNICMCCQGIRPYANGYLWRYVDEDKP